uniref:Uncharacterized protein n=1 Tax=Panagrolaimus sp. ES5 TaxID=591445 RepID=A0AC34FGD4_9BILA
MIYLCLLLLLSFFQNSFQKDNCISIDIVEAEGHPTIPTWFSDIDLADPTSECPSNPCRSVDDFYDSYNLIEIKKHLLWLRRTREKYFYCCQKSFNCSKHEIVKEMFAFILVKQKQIPTVRFEPEPFKNFWILIIMGSVFFVAVIIHVTISLCYMCSFQKKKTTEEASGEKFEHDSAALIQQNAVLPNLFPLKVPNTSMYSNLTAKESEQLTEKTAKSDVNEEETLIDWTATEAQKDYNQKAAELRKKLQSPKKPIISNVTTTQQTSTALELESTQLKTESTQTCVDKTQSESIRKRNL